MRRRAFVFLMLAVAVGLVQGAVAPRRPIVVVKPMESCAPGDRAYAAALSGHVVRWLREGGVAADLVDDRALEQALAGRRLAYLVMLQSPHAAQLGAIKRFLARGGRVCVFFSKSPELAALMGVKLGAYRKAGPAGFENMLFTARGPAGAPTAIVQSSGGIFTARPLPGHSSVLAEWTDAAGRRTGEPAILSTKVGWWLTHVLLAEGDEKAKMRFLLSVAGAMVPGSWDAAAWMARERSRQSQMVACAKRQRRRPGELHAGWDDSGTGLYPGDWPRTMRLLASSGITDLFVNVAGAGFAHYPTPCLPASSVCKTRGDQLAQCLAAAKGTGIRVHAWIICFNGTRSTASQLAAFAKSGWRLRDRKGRLTEYLDPRPPALRARLLAAMEDIARRYPVAGVHLDFVRWYEGAGKPQNAAKVIEDFVSAARGRVNAARPGTWLTAATLASYPSCVTSVGQDWERWIARRLVDYVVPMNYVEDNAKYAALLTRQGRTPEQARHIVSGLGVTANESRLGPVKVIDQIGMARRAGLAGVAFFDLDHTLATEILPMLRLGMF